LVAINDVLANDQTPKPISYRCNSSSLSMSSSLDGISILIIKELKWELLPALTKIIKQSLREGRFPQAWKISKIIPVYKKVDVRAQKITGHWHWREFTLGEDSCSPRTSYTFNESF